MTLFCDNIYTSKQMVIDMPSCATETKPLNVNDILIGVSKRERPLRDLGLIKQEIINKNSSGHAFYLACTEKNDDMAKALLEIGIIPTYEKQQYMALSFACQASALTIAKMLCLIHGDLNSNDGCFLHTAVNENNTDVTLWLIEKGAKSYGFHTFNLLRAAIKGNTTILHALINKGDDPACLSSSQIRSLVKYATPEALELLISQGLSLSNNDDLITSAFHRKSAPMIEIVSKNGQDVTSEMLEKAPESLIKKLYGSPINAVNNLPEAKETLLPPLLKRMFKKTKTTPIQYLKTCPEWHRKWVGKVIASSL